VTFLSAGPPFPQADSPFCWAFDPPPPSAVLFFPPCADQQLSDRARLTMCLPLYFIWPFFVARILFLMANHERPGPMSCLFPQSYCPFSSNTPFFPNSSGPSDNLAELRECPFLSLICFPPLVNFSFFISVMKRLLTIFRRCFAEACWLQGGPIPPFVGRTFFLSERLPP